MARFVHKVVRMADIQQKNGRFHVRRGGLAEVKKITDPYEFAVAAADFLGAQPIAVPPGFSPAAELLCGMKIDAWSRAKALPLAKVAGRLSVAFADPFDLPAQEEVSRWNANWKEMRGLLRALSELQRTELRVGLGQESAAATSVRDVVPQRLRKKRPRSRG